MGMMSYSQATFDEAVFLCIEYGEESLMLTKAASINQKYSNRLLGW